MHSQKILWVSAIFLFTTLACGLSRSTPDTTTLVETVSPTDPPPVETSELIVEDVETVVIEEEVPTSTPEPVEAEPTEELVEFFGTTDLSTLSAHRITYIQESDGVNTSDEPATTRVELFIETTQDPFAKHSQQKNIVGALTEDAAEATIFEIENYHVDNVAY
ncbi:MAG: hypothetical protein AAF485_19655, partial [Chloroflexota bacterium]